MSGSNPIERLASLFIQAISAPAGPVSLLFDSNLNKHRPPGRFNFIHTNDHSKHVPSPPERLWWLKRPLKRQAVFAIKGNAYTVKVYDQPGRWMPKNELNRLFDDILDIAHGSLDRIPKYGIFLKKRAAFENRIIAVAYDNHDNQPAGFTAMVYLPYQQKNKVMPIVHLGLTMIRKDQRGKRLQTPLFKKIFLLSLLNQRRISFTITNIAASPAGIGATSDYFHDVFPNYKGTVRQTDYHLDVARQIINNFRQEFGCSVLAVFEPDTFLVRGSNQEQGGGASEFIKEDPVSRYRIDACNDFCRRQLNFEAGDEMFQVGKVSLVQSSWASRRSRRNLNGDAVN